MRSWTRPVVPRLPGRGAVPRIYDTATRQLVEADPVAVAGLYVCGITPYDATHIGHAATYLAFDTLIRVWLDAGCDVRYVQNTTDVDDPLLERAAATGVGWRTLAAEQTDLFRRDMERLGVIPPYHYVAATEMIDVSHTSRVSGASKFIFGALMYWALEIASFSRYEPPLVMIIITRMTKIHTSSCTCTAGARTATRMNEMRATPVTP